MTDALDHSNPADAAVISKLIDLVGEYFAARIANDSAWARELIGMGPSDSS
jgi:transcription initiation factor TFIID subunit 6